MIDSVIIMYAFYKQISMVQYGYAILFTDGLMPYL